MNRVTAELFSSLSIQFIKISHPFPIKMSVIQDFRAVENVFPRIPETFSDNFIIIGGSLCLSTKACWQTIFQLFFWIWREHAGRVVALGCTPSSPHLRRREPASLCRLRAPFCKHSGNPCPPARGSTRKAGRTDPAAGHHWFRRTCSCQPPRHPVHAGSYRGFHFVKSTRSADRCCHRARR